MRSDEVFVAGPTAKTAADLLDRAVKAGLSVRVVRSTVGGFIVPAAIIDAPEAPKPARRRTKKPADGQEVEERDA